MDPIRPNNGASRKPGAVQDSVSVHGLHLSVLSLGEIRRGIETLKVRSAKRERLRVWLEQDLPAWFETRLLPVDAAA